MIFPGIWSKNKGKTLSRNAGISHSLCLHHICTVPYSRKEICTTLQPLQIDSEEREHLLVPGLMSDMSIKGPVFWMRAGWWTDTPVQKLWGFPVWLNSVSVTGIVALSSPIRDRMNKKKKKSYCRLKKTDNNSIYLNVSQFSLYIWQK